MRIQHNIMAMNAYRNYTNNVSAMKANLEKLSSGYKINRAGDDAAGLAISEKMRAQITGLETAQKNAKDGISLVQTAEGALTEVHDMLNRMVELATQSANGTYDNETDRAQLQKELDQLRTEIDRIADSSNFNGIKLLDGSMDANAIVGAKYTNVDASQILGLIPETDAAQDQTTVQNQKTVTETESLAASEAGFEIDLENVSINAGAGTFTLKIGDEEFTAALDADTAKAAKGSDLATAFAKDNTTASIGGNDYNVTVDGSKLVFKAADETANIDMTTNAKVTYTFAEDNPTPGDLDDNDAKDLALTPVKVTGNVPTTGSPVTGYAYSTGSTLDLTKVATVMQEVAPNAAALKIGVGTGDYADKLVLTDGTNVIGYADIPATGLAATTPTDFTFTGTDAAKTDLGTIKLTANAAKTADEIKADFATAVAINGVTVTAATTATTAAGTDLSDALDAAGAGSGNVSVKFKETNAGGDDIYEVTVGGKTIEATGTVNNGVLTLAADDADGNTQTLLTLTGPTTTNAAGFKTALANSFDTGIAYTSNSTATISGTIDGGIQNPTSYNSGAASKVANTTVEFGSVDAWTDGAKITLGDTTYTVALGKDSVFKNASNVIDLTDMETADAATAAQRLAVAAKDNSTFIVGHDGAGKTTLQQRLSVKDSTDMTTREKIAGYLGVSTQNAEGSTPKAGTGLTLQIGDTADSYNQLKVDIKDMHSAALGLDKISIADQESAAAAISAIKNAINAVSDVRGTLGATQNRLDHTINNLSVMTENIQDAESTIRDTDVAEEMMAYTKNNILIQSAQAMLAQANQVPQGVLQLLQ